MTLNQKLGVSRVTHLAHINSCVLVGKRCFIHYYSKSLRKALLKVRFLTSVANNQRSWCGLSYRHSLPWASNRIFCQWLISDHFCKISCKALRSIFEKWVYQVHVFAAISTTKMLYYRTESLEERRQEGNAQVPPAKKTVNLNGKIGNIVDLNSAKSLTNHEPDSSDLPADETYRKHERDRRKEEIEEELRRKDREKNLQQSKNYVNQLIKNQDALFARYLSTLFLSILWMQLMSISDLLFSTFLVLLFVRQHHSTPSLDWSFNKNDVRICSKHSESSSYQRNIW